MFFHVSTLFQPLPVHKQFTTPPLSHLSFPFPSLHSRHRPISTPVPLCHTHSSSTISAIASFIRIPLSSNPLPYNVIDWRLFYSVLLPFLLDRREFLSVSIWFALVYPLSISFLIAPAAVPGRFLFSAVYLYLRSSHLTTRRSGGSWAIRVHHRPQILQKFYR